MLGWNLFVFDDMGLGLQYMRTLFGLCGGGFLNQETIYLLYNNAVLLLLLILGSTRIPAGVGKRIAGALQNRDWAALAVRGVFYTGVFLLSVAWLVDASYNPFLYFRF